MARPIKETPTLRGEEARDFERKVQNPQTVSSDEVKAAKDSYKRIMAIAKFVF